MKNPRYTALTKRLPSAVPFVAPEMIEKDMGKQFKARLGANENGFGPSPKAIKAMAEAGAEIWKYAHPNGEEIRKELAKINGLSAENFILGGGIDGLLGQLCRLLLETGDDVVTSLGGYPTFNYHVTGFGGNLHSVPFKEDHEDIDGLLEMAHQIKPKLLYLCNPDNPMGTWHSAERVQHMIDNTPEETLMILDEAYIELADPTIAPAFDMSNPNIIRFRTLSKAYGMAGARVGYGIGHKELIKSFDKIRDHFGMCRTSQVGALAALKDQVYLNEVQGRVAQARERLYQIAKENGMKAIPSNTNFVTIDCGGDGDYARAILEKIVEQDVFIRMPFVSPQDRCIRVSVGPDSELTQFSDALKIAIKQVN